MPNEWKTGDTWPWPRLQVSDDDGPVDISGADEVRVIGRLGGLVFSGAMTDGTVNVIDDGTVPLRGIHEYVLQDDDLSAPGEWELETEVTWDNATTPPRRETYPNAKSRNPTMSVSADLDLEPMLLAAAPEGEERALVVAAPRESEPWRWK